MTISINELKVGDVVLVYISNGRITSPKSTNNISDLLEARIAGIGPYSVALGWSEWPKCLHINHKFTNHPTLEHHDTKYWYSYKMNVCVIHSIVLKETSPNIKCQICSIPAPHLKLDITNYTCSMCILTKDIQNEETL